MDRFSAGCVFAELFLEGTLLFTLFKYREGESKVKTRLTAVGARRAPAWAARWERGPRTRM